MIPSVCKIFWNVCRKEEEVDDDDVCFCCVMMMTFARINGYVRMVAMNLDINPNWKACDMVNWPLLLVCLLFFVDDDDDKISFNVSYTV